MKNGRGKGTVPQQVFISSNGPSVSFSAAASTTFSRPWLSVTRGSTTPASVTVSVSSDLAPGTYSGTLSPFRQNEAVTNSPLLLSVILVVTNAPPPQPLTLMFPVPSDSACGGVCTPSSAPINAIFDHQMLNAYEAHLKKNDRGICSSVPTPLNWGTIVDFLGETANISVKNGYGDCHDLFGYHDTVNTMFLQGVNYNDNVLWYDSHPGYDYNFRIRDEGLCRCKRLYFVHFSARPCRSGLIFPRSDHYSE